MVVNTVPSLAQVFDSLLETRAAHSDVGGPPLVSPAAGARTPEPADTGQTASKTSTLQINILA
jgi:hypothetical protein